MAGGPVPRMAGDRRSHALASSRDGGLRTGPEQQPHQLLSEPAAARWR
jgi:hypothetical protein